MMYDMSSMDLLAYYEMKTESDIDEDKEIKSFKDGISNEITFIKSFRSNTGMVSKLLHPIATVKMNARELRLKRIKRGLERISDSDLLEYVTLEEKDFNDELLVASSRKLNAVKKYVRKNQEKSRK